MMLARLRALHPGSSVPRILFYAVCLRLARFALRVFFRVRWIDSDAVPASGPLLIVANHQSYLDPPLVSTGILHRHIDFIARAGLFRNRLFGWLIGTLNSIPITEQGGDTAAMKEALRRLATGRAVLLFPEGSRTRDGAMTPFKRGVAVLVKRAKCPVLPVAIEGAYDAWPRGRAAPRLFGCRAAVRYGDPIPHAELMAEGSDAALRWLEREIDAMRLELRTEIRRWTNGRCPAPGPADASAFGETLDETNPDVE